MSNKLSLLLILILPSLAYSAQTVAMKSQKAQFGPRSKIQVLLAA